MVVAFIVNARQLQERNIEELTLDELKEFGESMDLRNFQDMFNKSTNIDDIMVRFVVM